ncbi:DUF6118 family protein [Sphingomonas sp. QA11]|nr:DUF6118 family protein [Sphingomonas sp. QA11]
MAGKEARAGEAAMLKQAQADMRAAASELRVWAESARNASDQRRRLGWAAAGGVLAGAALWTTLPGVVARAAPASWSWPERIAARGLRLDMWEAGERLLSRSDVERWRTVVLANRMLQDNREDIVRCRQMAAKAAKAVRCTIVIKADASTQKYRSMWSKL